MSLDALIGEVLLQVPKIARDVLRREGTRLRTATVTAESPTRIRYDGETESSIVTPRRTVRVASGNRVVVAKARGQATIVGVLTQQELTWQVLTYAPGITYAGHGFFASVQRDGERRFMHGRVARVGGTSFASGTSYLIGTLPPEDRPTQAAGGIGQVAGFASPGFARVEILPDGSVTVAVSSATAWVGLDSITWDIR